MPHSFPCIWSLQKRAPGCRGARVRWDTTAGIASGVTAGIDESGALLVHTGETVERLVAGEVRFFGPPFSFP